MKRKISLWLLIAGCLASCLNVSAKPQKPSKDDEAIKAVIRGFWSITSEQDIRRVISAPYIGLSVRDKGSVMQAFGDKAALEKFLKEMRIAMAAANKELAKQPMNIGGPVLIVQPKPQISQLKITRPSASVAYVSYKFTVVPNPTKKLPVPLLAVLRKEKNSWKLVFSATP